MAIINLNMKIPDKIWERPVFFTTEIIKTQQGTVIPVGTKTDGASVPRLFLPAGVALIVLGYGFTNIGLLILGVLFVLVRDLFPSIGRYFKESIEHDYLTSLNRWREANDKFKLGLQRRNIAPWRVQVISFSVRIYAWVRRVVLWIRAWQQFKRI